MKTTKSVTKFAAKKPVARTSASKKTLARKTVARKTVARLGVGNKTIGKKTAGTKTVAKTSATKRMVAKSILSKNTSSSSAMPRVGDLAPDFSLTDQSGRVVSLKQLRGAPVVVYFYPKDDTPGCTIEAKAFSADYAAFQAKGVRVFGVSKDSVESHCDFTAKYTLGFPLLSDPSGKMVAAYGCWVEKNMYGRKYMGIQRATFVIDANGKIMKVFPKVSPEGHSTEVLALF